MDRERRLPPGVRVAAPLRHALDEWQAAVVRLDAVDAVTTELVRLRAAAVHDCRVCGSLRLVDAREAGVDDAMTAKIERYEDSDLPDRHKVALRLADAMMSRPGDISPALARDLREHFTAAQILELTLDVMKWTFQKVAVTLRTDVPAPAGTGLRFDTHGHPIVGEPDARRAD